MKRIFVIAESMNYEKHLLLNYPLTKEFYEYLSKKYNKDSKNKNINEVNSSEELSDLELYLKLFILDNHVNQNFIFDIIIDKDRFISFPIWFSKYEYDKRKKIEQEKDDYKNRPNINKNVDKYTGLNMFNIVFVFSNEGPMNINRELFKNVYSNLESLSKLLLFEEYNRHYLGIETESIIKKIKRIFKQKKENINYVNFVEKFPQNNNFYAYIKNIYDGITKNEISNVIVSNIELNYYIGTYKNQLSSFKIRPYHCIIINNKKNLNNFFQSIKDTNPKILIIIDKIIQLKTLEEISLENNIDLNFVLFFAYQLVSWNLGKIIFKINNYSTFQINDSIPDGIIKWKLQEGLIGFNIAINILNQFTTSESTTTLNEIYQENFNSIDIEEFKKCILYFVENHYLVQTAIIIVSKLKIKDKLNYQNSMIKKFSDLIIHENLFDEQIDDDNDENIYYEDFLKLVKDKSMEDFIILSNIKELISKYLYINEISYYTGYKIKDILNTVNKYEAIFDLVVVPL